MGGGWQNRTTEQEVSRVLAERMRRLEQPEKGARRTRI